MDIDKVQSARAHRPPPPRLNPTPSRRPLPSSITGPDVTIRTTTILAEIDLNYVLAMDSRVREVVNYLREHKSCLILDPERLEAQEEEAAAELYVVLQNVSSCKVIEADAERAYERSKSEAYSREMERAQLRLDQWKAHDDWVKRKGPGWEPLKAWEKLRDVMDKKRAMLNVSNTSPAKRAEIQEWIKENVLPNRPKDPPEPTKPEGPAPSAEVKVTDVKKTADVDEVVEAAHTAYRTAHKNRREAEDYAAALQQKLSLISGMQGARNRGI